MAESEKKSPRVETKATEGEVTCHAYHFEVEENHLTGRSDFVIWGIGRGEDRYYLRQPNCPVFCYISLPRFVGGRRAVWNQETTLDIYEWMRKELGKKSEDDIPIKYSYSPKKELYNYQGGRKATNNKAAEVGRTSPMMLVSFKTLKAMKNCYSFLSKPQNIYPYGVMDLKIWESNIDMTRKLFSLKKCKYTQWFTVKGKEIPIGHPERTASPGKNNRIRELIIDYQNIKPLDPSKTKGWISHPDMLAFDIETYSSNHKKMPDELCADHPAYMIQAVYQTQGARHTRERYVILIGDCKEIKVGESILVSANGRKYLLKPDVKIYRVQTELELLKTFPVIIKECDPDVVTGYNIMAYDWRYLDVRLGMQYMGEWPQMGRIEGRTAKMHKREWKSGAYGHNIVCNLIMDGRLNIDLLPLVKRAGYRLPKFTLDVVAKHFLKRGKHPVKAEQMFETFEFMTEARKLKETMEAQLEHGKTVTYNGVVLERRDVLAIWGLAFQNQETKFQYKLETYDLHDSLAIWDAFFLQQKEVVKEVIRKSPLRVKKGVVKREEEEPEQGNEEINKLKNMALGPLLSPEEQARLAPIFQAMNASAEADSKIEKQKEWGQKLHFVDIDIRPEAIAPNSKFVSSLASPTSNNSLESPTTNEESKESLSNNSSPKAATPSRIASINAGTIPFIIHNGEKLTVKDVTEIWNAALELMTTVVEYGVEDAELVVDLFEKLYVWVDLVEMASIVGVTIMDLFTRGQQVRCQSQIYDYAMRENFVLNKRVFSKLAGFAGGYTKEPIIGLHKNIICLDFRSLYPSIIIAYNICYTTFVPKEYDNEIPDEDCNIFEFEQEETVTKKKVGEDGENDGFDGNEFVQDDVAADAEAEPEEGKEVKEEEKVVKVKHRYRFIKKEILEGILPRLLSNLVAERNAVKKQIKTLDASKKKIDSLLTKVKKRLGLIDESGNEIKNLGSETKDNVEEVKVDDATIQKLIDEDKTLDTDCQKEIDKFQASRHEELELNTLEKGLKSHLANLKIIIDDLTIQLVVLDKRQNGLKVSANSVFGFLGVRNGGMLPLLEGAMCITAQGRKLITEVDVYMKKKYNADIVYGDTDSSMIDMHITDKTQCDKIGKQLADEISGTPEVKDDEGKVIKPAVKGLFPPPLGMEFEKCMGRLLTLTKKKYAYIETDDNGDLEKDPDTGDYIIVKKGVVPARRDNCAFLRDNYTLMLKHILLEGSMEDAFDMMINAVLKLYSGTLVPRNSLAVIRELGANYASESYFLRVFSLELARVGKQTTPGERLEYVVVKTEPEYDGEEVKLGLKMRDIDMWEDSQLYYNGTTSMIEKKELTGTLAALPERFAKLLGVTTSKNEKPIYLAEKIDYQYYVGHSLMNPLDQLFSLSYGKQVQKYGGIGYKPTFSRAHFCSVVTPLKLVDKIITDFGKGDISIEEMVEFIAGLKKWFRESITKVDEELAIDAEEAQRLKDNPPIVEELPEEPLPEEIFPVRRIVRISKRDKLIDKDKALARDNFVPAEVTKNTRRDISSSGSSSSSDSKSTPYQTSVSPKQVGESPCRVVRKSTRTIENVPSPHKEKNPISFRIESPVTMERVSSLREVSTSKVSTSKVSTSKASTPPIRIIRQDRSSPVTRENSPVRGNQANSPIIREKSSPPILMTKSGIRIIRRQIT
jgi:DNA polymerase elongation subunit (family B)